jgi:hypothetical protein
MTALLLMTEKTVKWFKKHIQTTAEWRKAAC